MKVFVLLLSALLLAIPLYGAQTDSGENVFPSIENSAAKWYEGRDGSTLYYESKLDDLLWRSRRKKVDIPSDFIISKPEVAGDIALSCAFEPRKWLEVRATITKVELEHLKVRHQGANWWRYVKITGVRGTIRKYRIDRSFTGKKLILYIDNFEFTAGKENDSKS